MQEETGCLKCRGRARGTGCLKCSEMQIDMYKRKQNGIYEKRRVQKRLSIETNIYIYMSA